MSKWFVGSSSIKRFTGSSNNLIIAKRERSPPESTLTFFSDISPPNIKAPKRSLIRNRISPFATWSMVSNIVRFSSKSWAWFCAKYPICTLCPIFRLPSKGISFMIHFTRVDFPSPFLPTKATFSPRLMVMSTFSNTRRDGYSLRTLSQIIG